MKLLRYFNDVPEEVFYDRSDAETVAVNSFFDQTYSATLNESITLADLVAGSIGGAGNVYNETLTESLSLADASQAQAVFASTYQEALDLNDILVGSLILSAFLVQALTLSDSLSNNATLNAALVQNLLLSDALSNTAALNATLSESIILVDTLTANIIVVASLAEAVALQDDVSGSVIFIGTINEALMLQAAFTGSAGAELDRVLHKLVLKPNSLYSTMHEPVTVYTFNIKNFITTHLSDMVQTQKVNLLVRRGDTFNTDEFRIERAAFDFTGTTARMRIRRKPTDPVLLEPTIVTDAIIGSATARPSATAAQLQVLPANEYVYDVDFTLPNGSVYTYFEGVFKVV